MPVRLVLSPSERAVAHKARAAKKAARRVSTPGPGEYECKGTLDNKRGGASHVFSSTAVRGITKKQATPNDLGPGTYTISKMNDGQNYALSDMRGENATAAM
eukprot:6169889-Prymnesium_polylepis.1